MPLSATLGRNNHEFNLCEKSPLCFSGITKALAWFTTKLFPALSGSLPVRVWQLGSSTGLAAWYRKASFTNAMMPLLGPTQDPDPITGHWPGWILVGDGPEDRWHREAFTGKEQDGTYELCGPKVQGNPERFERHVLVPHGKEVLEDAPRSRERVLKKG